MEREPGIITLMGSGELTTTMVEVHKSLLHRYGDGAKAVFMDTPAGFQLNVDHISRKASDYFQKRVQRPLTIASLKSADADQQPAVEQACREVRTADYVLIGPGSPTYALRQWQQTDIPGIFNRFVLNGGTLVAASAAALTVGRATLPVYEIYKVGAPPHWVDGLDLLAAFGMNWAVIPHWNNAEGGNHDTRYCFMGAPRLRQLESQLPEGTGLLGLDEHTALIIDLAREQATIRGIGRITLRRNGREAVFDKGDKLPLALLRGQTEPGRTVPAAPLPGEAQSAATGDQPATTDGIWQPVERLADQVQAHLAANRIEPATHRLLELERHIAGSWEALQERSADGAAREVLRNMLVLFGTRLAERPASRKDCMAPLVEALLDLRTQLRARKQWQLADAIRDSLQQAGVVAEDTSGGVRWHLAG